MLCESCESHVMYLMPMESPIGRKLDIHPQKFNWTRNDIHGRWIWQMEDSVCLM